MAVSPAPCHPETPPRPGKPVTTRDWVTGAIRLRSTLESLPVEELIPKSLKCCRMAKEETPSISKDLQELWRKLSLLIDSVQNNSKVVAFMKSPVGQYLDKHPFVALTLLVFVVVSAVPVGFFLLLVVLTSLAAFVGVILLEGSGSFQLFRVNAADSLSCRTGHLRGRPLPVLCPLWLGLRVTRHFRDHHRVLRGGFQPHQPLVFFRTTDTRLQRGLPTDCEARGLGGALPGMSRRRSCSFPPGISGGWDHTCLWGCDSEGTRWSSTPWGGVPGFFTCE
ncbi:lipid droplet assembly factor 1 isoform X3 [Molossus molossus]|uniref:lipid droplet assembly factor 1 isoform X3 n=1 Tax=Molossus molossus TaxID=27622 RepID=UPI00174786E9|nr:lipid droplet assembly factor 1 isoform X3 [Molossus molossus]